MHIARTSKAGAALRLGSKAAPRHAPPKQARYVEASAATATDDVKIGARGTKLSLFQAEQVKQQLLHSNDECLHTAMHIVSIETHGDRDRALPLRQLGSGAFTVLIDEAVASSEVDIGVHSMKDSPVCLPDGVVLACCLPREDPRDALICLKARSLGDLPAGSKVGTSSMRRKAQILARYPHLQVVPLRGSLEQRLKLLEQGEVDATVLAVAGLNRLGLAHMATSILEVQDMLPAACQGVVGVTCREADAGMKWDLSLITHEPTLLEVSCERAVLAELMPQPASSQPKVAAKEDGEEVAAPANGSGPSTAAAADSSSSTGLARMPDFAVACNSKFDRHAGEMTLIAMVASEDGRVMETVSEIVGAARVYDAVELGKKVGRQLRAFATQQGWLPEEEEEEEVQEEVAPADEQAVAA